MADINFDESKFLQDLKAFKIFKGTSTLEIKKLVPLFRHMELSFLDYMTIRDLLGFGGYEGDTAIVMVLVTMFASLQEGSLCIDLDKKKFLDRLPADMQKEAGEIMSGFLSGLSKDKYKKLIARNNHEYMPLILNESGQKRMLYFQKYYAHENRFKERIETFLKTESSFKVSDREIDNLLEEIYSDTFAIRNSRSNIPIAKDSQQLKAIQLTLKSQFSIVSGGPGTGKTFLIVNILRCLVRAGIRISKIILGAPTGRAAQRMTESIQNNIATIQKPSPEDSDLLNLKGSTLHKILRYRRHWHDFYYHDMNPLPASVVVVDEVSMVDVVMLDNFIQAIDPGKTKIIFLGDKDQLPSVEAGAVFSEMIPDGTRGARFKDRFTVLHKIYRSGNNLMQLARQANQGTFPPFTWVSFETALSMGPDQWAFINADTISKWQEHIHLWVKDKYISPLSDHGKSYKDLIREAEQMNTDRLMATEHGQGLLHRIFMIVENSKILSIIRNGIYGCIGINNLIVNYLSNEFNPPEARQTDAFSGAVIIITRNDYSKELFNGDIGVILEDPNGTARTFFHRSGSYISFPVNLLPSWELAFAITVHKSQGSEFDDVLLVLPEDENHRLLSRKILYTGITRAKKRVFIYGSMAALNTALEKKIERQSGLMW